MIIATLRVKAELIQTAELEGCKLEVFIPFVASPVLLYVIFTIIRKNAEM